MPPKKACAAGPSKRKRGGVADPTFVNERAAELFQSSIVHRKCIQERGFGELIDNRVEPRKWTTLVAQPEAALVPVIREFYANAREQLASNPTIFRTLVRGKEVPYDRHTINRFYKLEDIPEDDYTAWMENEPNYNEIIELLARPGAEWKKQNDQVYNFKANWLTPPARMWHLFISGKLMPSGHITEVTKERAKLNYAILTGLSIDVGRVIEQSIISFITGRLTSGLGHPSLIYALCLQAGVSTTPSEEIQHPLQPITYRMYVSFQKRAETVAEPSATTATTSQPQPEAAHHSSNPPMADWESRMKNFEDQQLRLYAQQRLHGRQLSHIVHEHRLQFDFMKNSITAITSLLQQSNMFPGADSMVLPTPPTFPHFPEHENSDDTEDNEEN